jgi:hypothetical protein
MLFIQPLFLLGSRDRRRTRLGYADDVTLLATSSSLEENNNTLAKDFQEVTEWAQHQDLAFDVSKTELMHFSRHRASRNPPVLLNLQGTEVIVEPVKIGGAIRYLGLWFDRKLSFKIHVATLAAKAKRTTMGIRALGNTVRGAPLRLLRQAVQSCVQTVLCYGAEAWWPGTCRMQKGRKVSNRVDGLVHKLDTIQNEALRSALPVYQIFPIAALQREAAVLPLHIALDHRAVLAAARIKRLDNRHPLVQRVKRKRSSNTETRLLRLAARAGPTEPHDPLARSPWELRIDRDDTRIGYIQDLTANEAAVGFRKWVATISQRDIIVYSDGSQLAEGSRAAGAGWVVSQGPGHNIVARGRLSLHRAEVFDAEAVCKGV